MRRTKISKKTGLPLPNKKGQGRPKSLKKGDMNRKISITFSITLENWFKVQAEMAKYTVKKSEVFEQMALSFFKG